MPKYYQKAMDNTLKGLWEVFFCFLADILIVSMVSVAEQRRLLEKVFVGLEEGVFALNLSRWEFSLNHLSWLGFDIDSGGHRPPKINAVLALEP